MKHLKTEEEIIGKTIKSIGNTGTWASFVFTDNSFCVIENGGYEGDTSLKICTNGFFSYANPSHINDLEALNDLGVIEPERYKEILNELEKKNDEKQKAKEIKQLQELKKKYPNI